MEEKVINGLKDLGYVGPLTDKKSLDVALQEGAKNIEYTKVVNFLTNEIRTLLNIDEEVNYISNSEDSITFIMEISSFLKELNCTYNVLTQGHASDRLQNVQDRLLLLDYLTTELMSARILQEKKPDKKIELKLQETSEAANMRKILMTLGFPRPPPNITIQHLFQKLCPTVQNTVQKVGKELVSTPAFSGLLSDKQWDILNNVQTDLNNEYKIRREMLLTRLDVTIQSFQWSDKTKGKDELIEKMYTEKRKCLKTDPEIELGDLLAARDDIAIIEKTSSSSLRKNTQSSLNKIIIGEVPDRGGRTSEQAPPPPEMPSWQQRTPGPAGGGRRGGSRGGAMGASYSSNQVGYDSYGGNKSNYSYNSGYTQGRNFDSAGGYGSSNYSSTSYSRQDNYEKPSSANYSGGRGNYSNDNAGSYRNFDSAGSYGTNYYQNTKRPKTTYADQYVQEEQNNRQYHGSGSNFNKRGSRSNYGRGGRNNY